VQDDDGQLAAGTALHTIWPGMLLFYSQGRKQWRVRGVEQLLLAWSWRLLSDVVVLQTKDFTLYKVFASCLVLSVVKTSSVYEV